MMKIKKIRKFDHRSPFVFLANKEHVMLSLIKIILLKNVYFTLSRNI